MSIGETSLAFVEGLALIVSPCILPVLPLVLATSVSGGRARPFGVIAGFTIMFGLFTLFARALLAGAGIDPETIRNISLVFLTLFGLTLLVEPLSRRFAALTGRLADFGGRIASRNGEGFASGVGIGAAIALVWTPCAGPILGAVLVQVIRQQDDAHAIAVIMAFALGAAMPMLAIALGGRALMAKATFLSRHADALRKGMGVLMLASVVFIASGAMLPSFGEPEKISVRNTALVKPLDQPYPAPDFAEIEQWFNTEPLTMAQLKGKVVLVDFWTYSCINCIRTLPYVTRWDREYRDDGLVVVGVHSPEFEFEKKPANVQAAIGDNGIGYPVAMDNRLSTFLAFKNKYWPAHYLIDKQGNVVYTHFGEGDYDVTENNIRFLLGLNDTAPAAEAIPVTSKGQTPETYLGYKRGKLANAVQGKPQRYEMAQSQPALNGWDLGGTWRVDAQKITALERGAAIRLHYKSGKVFLVMGIAGEKPVDVIVTHDGKQTSITVDRNRLYELVANGAPREGIVTITAQDAGLEAYAFTFGN